MRLGEAIKSAREEAGLSQREVAERMGVSQPHVSRYENNDGRNFKLSTLLRISEAIGVDLKDMLADCEFEETG